MKRRNLLAGMVTAPLGAGVLGQAATSNPASPPERVAAGRSKLAGPPGFKTGKLDLSKPLDNLTALLKLQADLSGRPVYSGFPGKVWSWVPGEGNTLLFNTYGIGASRLEYSPQDEAFRFLHREALYYCDPKTNEVLEEWRNPLTGDTLEVLHILNDPVNRLYALSGGPFPPPYPYLTYGDRVIFQIDVLRSTEKNPLTRREYPLHAQQDLYQSGELWAITGSRRQIDDPAVTSAECHTSWKRIAMWLPFMEMGDRPGVLIYHSQSFKFMDGWASLPANVREYTQRKHPQYLEPPVSWEGLAKNETTWSYSKKVIDERRAQGKARGASVFRRS